MHEEDLKNLMGWLQAIYKETQQAHGATNELRKNVDLIPDIKNHTERGSHDSNEADRKIEEARNHLENQIRKLEDILHEVRHELKDIHSKLDRLK